MSRSMTILIAAVAAASGAAGALALRGPSTKSAPAVADKGPAACCAVLPKRFAAGPSTLPVTQPSAATAEASHAGMKWIAGGEFDMGSQDADARADERPIHR